jgi:hypothetical protein
MLPFDLKLLDTINENSVNELAELDKHGFIPGRKETIDEYRSRLKAIVSSVKEFDQELASKGEVEVFDGISLHQDDKISKEIISEATDMTWKLYRFAIDWVPGFFLSRDVGLLWGGCAITDTEKPLTVFLIRNSFRNRKKWFIYDRQELLAHELCHASRCAMRDFKLEEFFAYQTAPSRIRRYLGNCFISKYDALLFLLPVLILLCAQILQTFAELRFPIWPFWILALSYPAYLFVRNQLARNRVFGAERKLKKFGIQEARAILFRCSWSETKELGKLETVEEMHEYTRQKAADNLRWRVIKHRFIDNQIHDDTFKKKTGYTEEAING